MRMQLTYVNTSPRATSHSRTLHESKAFSDGVLAITQLYEYLPRAEYPRSGKPT